MTYTTGGAPLSRGERCQEFEAGASCQIVVERQDVEPAVVETAQSVVRTGCKRNDETQPSKLLLHETR